MVYTTPLVGGLIACIVVVRVEPQISTVVHYYFYSTVAQNLFKSKGTDTQEYYARGSETTVITELRMWSSHIAAVTPLTVYDVTHM